MCSRECFVAVVAVIVGWDDPHLEERLTGGTSFSFLL